MISKNYKQIFLAVISGFLLTASFPKIGISWFAWISLIPMLLCISDLSPKDAFRIGFIAGISHYTGLLYWLTDTMMTYGYLPRYIAVPLLFLLAAYVSLYIGTFAFLLRYLCKTPLHVLIMTPIIWVSLEYFRSFLLTGFPWGLIGYSQVSHLQLIQIADIFGVYGVSFLVAFANGVIFIIVLSFKSEVSKKISGISIASLIIMLSLVLGYGNLQIRELDKQIAASPSINVSVIQGNIAQTEKWNPEFQIATIQKYIDLSLSTKEKRPDLVVWPETATPFYLGYHLEPTEQVMDCVRKTNAHFLIGSPSFVQIGKETEYHNSAYLVNPDGSLKAKYDKVHLVPYGEYVPLRKWMPFLGKIVEHVGDFKAGDPGRTLDSEKFSLGVQICYEIIFPELSASMADNGASLLVNITNDAWFGTSSGPYQHFDQAVFRAVENKRSLVRSANTGISGFIDPIGRIKESTPLLREAAINHNMPLIQQKTFYSRFGNWLPILCCFITLAAVFLKIIKRKQ